MISASVFYGKLRTSLKIFVSNWGGISCCDKKLDSKVSREFQWGFHHWQHIKDFLQDYLLWKSQTKDINHLLTDICAFVLENLLCSCFLPLHNYMKKSLVSLPYLVMALFFLGSLRELSILIQAIFNFF